MAIRSKLLLDTVVPYRLIGKSIMRSICPRWTFFLPSRTFVYHQIETCPYKSRCSDRVKEFRAIVLQLLRTGCYRQIARSGNAEDSKHRETNLRTDEALDFLHFICKELSDKFTQNSYLFLFPGWASPEIWFYGLVLFITKLVSILWKEFDI